MVGGAHASRSQQQQQEQRRHRRRRHRRGGGQEQEQEWVRGGVVELTPPWPLLAFGQPMVRRILQHFASTHDAQTVATMTCTLSSTAPGGSDEQRQQQPHGHGHQGDIVSSLLPPLLARQFYPQLQHYAGLLHRWGLVNTRMQVLKFVVSAAPQGERERGVVLLPLCRGCKRPSPGALCVACGLFAQRCGVCNRPVRGAAMWCFACGHGGHRSHIQDWFSEQSVCPTGCGCMCMNPVAPSLTGGGGTLTCSDRCD